MQEVWRKLPFCEFYEVSNMGRVKSTFKGVARILKPYVRGDKKMMVMVNIRL